MKNTYLADSLFPLLKEKCLRLTETLKAKRQSTQTKSFHGPMALWFRQSFKREPPRFLLLYFTFPVETRFQNNVFVCFVYCRTCHRMLEVPRGAKC